MLVLIIIEPSSISFVSKFNPSLFLQIRNHRFHLFTMALFTRNLVTYCRRQWIYYHLHYFIVLHWSFIKNRSIKHTLPLIIIKDIQAISFVTTHLHITDYQWCPLKRTPDCLISLRPIAFHLPSNSQLSPDIEWSLRSDSTDNVSIGELAVNLSGQRSPTLPNEPEWSFNWNREEVAH